jgi:hypothetical protein
LIYTDNVVGLESHLEDVQSLLDGIVEWGKKYGMELSRDKCSIIIWKGGDTRSL